jgi:hypothetical protein
MTRFTWYGIAATLAAIPVQAQSLASRIDAVRDGTVLMTFAARPGVCGDGHGSTWTRDPRSVHDASDRQWVCMPGPVRVALGRADKQTISIRTRVGGRWSAASSETDLGDVPAADAAHYLIDLARTLGGRSAGEALSAAAFADAGDLSPEFERVVRDDAASLETRKQALFWLGQGELPTRDLAHLYDGLGPFALREHFTFVISQRHDDLAIDKLIDVARRDPDLQIRKQAMFWLGQSREPRAIKFFKDLLTR